MPAAAITHRTPSIAVAVATTKILGRVDRDSGKMVDGRCRSRSQLHHPLGITRIGLNYPTKPVHLVLSILYHKQTSTRCIPSLYRWRSYSRLWRAVITKGYWPVSSYVCAHILLLPTLILTFAPREDLQTYAWHHSWIY